MHFSRDSGGPVDDPAARRAGPDRPRHRADLRRIADRDALGNPRRLRRLLCSGLFQRLDEPGQIAGGFLGDAERPQRLGDPAAGAAPDRLFRHRRQNGGELPEGAGGPEAVRDHRGVRAHHRRPGRHRGQFRGRLGGRRRHRRTGGRGADGRRARQRALCFYHPGPADEEWSARTSRRAGDPALSTKNNTQGNAS